MRNRIFLLMLSLIISMISSCHEEKKKAVFYDTESEATTDATDSNDDVIIVPFEEIGGVKYVNVKVNGIGFEMIFDTGASTTLISLAEARYLWDKNLLTQDDIIKREQYTVADGSICDGLIVNLKEVVIDDQIVCRNVLAYVSNTTKSPLLLGNEAIDRVASFSIDNEAKTINFKLNE